MFAHNLIGAVCAVLLGEESACIFQIIERSGLFILRRAAIRYMQTGGFVVAFVLIARGRGVGEGNVIFRLHVASQPNQAKWLRAIQRKCPDGIQCIELFVQGVATIFSSQESTSVGEGQVIE